MHLFGKETEINLEVYIALCPPHLPLLVLPDNEASTAEKPSGQNFRAEVTNNVVL